MSDMKKRQLLQVAQHGSRAQVRTWRNLLAAFQNAESDFDQFGDAVFPLAKMRDTPKPSEIEEQAANLKAAIAARDEFIDAVIAILKVSVVNGAGEVFQNCPVSRKAQESS